LVVEQEVATVTNGAVAGVELIALRLDQASQHIEIPLPSSRGTAGAATV
jgi:hypothetical protein